MLEARSQPAAYATLLEQYETLLDPIPAVFYIAEIGVDGACTFVSPHIESLLGFTPSEWIADPHLWNRQLHVEDRDWVLAAENRHTAEASREPQTLEYRLLHRDGHVVWVKDHSVLVPDSAGTLHWRGVLVDVTAQTEAEHELKRHADAQSQVAQLGVHALQGTSISQLVEEALTAVAEVLDVDATLFAETAEGNSVLPRAQHGLTHLVVGEPQTGLGPNTQHGHTVRTGEAVVVDDWRTDTRFERSEAFVRRGFRSTMSVRIEGPEQPFGILGVFSEQPRAFTQSDVDFVQSLANVLADALQRQHAEDQLEHRALHDSLTGLPNRVLFLDRLEQALERARRRQTSLGAVLFVDLDHFKHINDALGHHAGDQLLSGVAARLKEIVGPTDTVARFGGDEFGVLLEEIHSERDAIATAERIAAGFARPFLLETGSQFVTASIGIALSGGREIPLDLLQDADAAMYRAKERGRARYELYDEEMRTRAFARMRLENDLRHALDLGELRLGYQPIVSLQDGSIVCVEALLRWDHRERGSVLPAEFLPVAEESGLIDRLGNLALEHACLDVANWSAMRPESRSCGVSLNISVQQLAGGRFVEQLQATLERSAIDPSLLSFELSERLLRDPSVGTRQSLRTLDQLGARLVIDDFGDGSVSFGELMRLPIASLKIADRFVASMDIPGSEGSVAAVTIALARALSIPVVAEGVETHSQAERLRELGCDLAQGFLFSPAVPPSQITTMLQAGGVLGERR
jgi:diguanylate cyclase (GGDEF)-like protein/PAS domain S-box-containing protein